VVAKAAGAGLVPVNADCTVLADWPRIAPHADEMAARLGRALGAPVSVKASGPEGLGALGRGEGVACLAVVLLDDAAVGGPP
jgi:2-C-methyl-D-erythritol 2,4-cyclodiphosphate synthase